MNFILNFFKDEEGAVMSEYALVLGLLLVVISSFVTSLGIGINTTITKATNQLPVV